MIIHQWATTNLQATLMKLLAVENHYKCTRMHELHSEDPFHLELAAASETQRPKMPRDNFYWWYGCRASQHYEVAAINMMHDGAFSLNAEFHFGFWVLAVRHYHLLIGAVLVVQ